MAISLENTAAGPGAPARRMRNIANMCLFIAILTGLVLLLSGTFWTTVFTSSFAMAIAVAGVGMLYGQLGLVNLAQFALVGVGGWVALRISHAFHIPFEFAALAGGVAASFVGVLWGLPALRLRGLFLALVTLMLAGAFQVVISVWGFPDGGPGFIGKMASGQRAVMERPLLAQGDAAYLIYVAMVMALMLALLEWHRISRPGRAWAFIRRDESMACMSGVNIVLYKAWAFALSGFLAGIAGALLAGSVGQLDGRAFLAQELIMVFALAIVGGAGSWLGAILGGILLRAAPALLIDFGVDGYVAQLLFGALLIHALLGGQGGAAAQFSDLGRFIARKIKETIGTKL